MKVGDWFKDPMGSEHVILALHPLKDWVILMSADGHVRGMPYYELASRWTKV